MWFRILLLAFVPILSAFSQPAQKRVNEVTFAAPWENVPEVYRRIPIGELRIPSMRRDWELQRPGIRSVLMECLGEVPARPNPLDVRTISREQRDGYSVEKLEIDNGIDIPIPAYVVIPDGLKKPAPAVLVLHWHSGDKDGVLFKDEAQNVLQPLLDRRFVVMAIDAYFHGERLGKGPGGVAENTYASQRDSLFKLNLWLGRTLWGMMLRDDQIALDYLQTRPEVDGSRLGVTGMSMGATQAWWLAAIDERVKAVVAVACFTRYTDLIAAGMLRAHAIYYFVPGILRHFDTEAVVGLVAPRPLLALTGDRDRTSPPTGVRALKKKVTDIYQLYDREDRFQSILYKDTGHVYTADMKQRMGRFFNRWLKEAQ